MFLSVAILSILLVARSGYPAPEDALDRAAALGVVRGRVVGEEGAPVAGAEVGLFVGVRDATYRDPTFDVPQVVTTTGQDGRFEIPAAREKNAIQAGQQVLAGGSLQERRNEHRHTHALRPD